MAEQAADGKQADAARVAFRLASSSTATLWPGANVLATGTGEPPERAGGVAVAPAEIELESNSARATAASRKLTGRG